MTTLPSGKRWNIFARELDAILQAHRFNLGHLTTKLGIHTEKVRRLKQSLTSSTFRSHLLNPQELEEISQAFQFTAEEQLRLRAALLATAIEELLMNRIDPDSALEAAEEVFPLLLRALHRRLGRQRGLAATRKDAFASNTAIEDTFEPILQQLNHAMLALHLGLLGSPLEQMEQTCNAVSGFTAVLAELEDLLRRNPDLHADAAWQLWYTEAQNNLARAQQQIALLKDQLIP